MVMIVNKVAPGTDCVQLRTDVEALFGTEVGAVLPLSTEMVRNASSGLFCYRYPAHPLTQELTAVVEKIILS
jgi:MinD-like ATPase involved in chromosome partitioning or flagellar assembly